jgi:DNA (cytosine-5)-methyltransferase 1
MGRQDYETETMVVSIQERAVSTNPDNGPGGIGVRSDGKAYTLEARNKVQVVAFAENSRSEVRLEGGDGSRTGALSTGGGKPGQGRPTVAVRECDSLPEVKYASEEERDAHKILRVLREKIGEEAFTEWGLGILDSLQQPEILRSALHGKELRPTTFSRRWVVCCALGVPFSRTEGALQSLREACGEGRSPQGRQLAEQLARQSGTSLPVLPHEGTSLSVRRLTPVETERLMGWPDGHTAHGVTEDGRTVDLADSHRYRLCGNGVVAPVAEWIGRRIMEATA